MKINKVTYAQVGDDYDTKDPIKKLAQSAGKETGKNLKKHGYEEISDTRGESAFVWKQGSVYMASVIEGLGTKNLVADAMRKIKGKTYYDVIGHDTVATIINDLISVGATPLVLHAYWAVCENSFLQDNERMQDFIHGWKTACDIAGVTWGGGETPTLKGIVTPNTMELGGSAVGIIHKKKNLILDTALQAGDAIILLKSTGINANGLSLARAVAKKLPKGYATPVTDKLCFGETILNKTNIYASLLQNLLKNNINIHYISNITGHGLRKIMRARPTYTYVIEKILEPQVVFPFIQKHANLSDDEMYQTYNMGMDYALFLKPSDIKKTLTLIRKQGFTGFVAGYVEKGEKQVVILPKNLQFKSGTLDLR